MVLASGCMAVGDEPTTITVDTDTEAPQSGPAIVKVRSADADAAYSSAPDVCELASALPTTDICSLICDPPAMATFLIDEGMQGGTCYQLRCVLSDENAVMVGVCLPPS
jgi:hypothetical protein